MGGVPLCREFILGATDSLPDQNKIVCVDAELEKGNANRNTSSSEDLRVTYEAIHGSSRDAR